MEVRVFWTETARSDLRVIYKYYKEIAGIEKAKKLVKTIIDRTIQLEKFPLSGPKEPLLVHRKNEYHYLVEGNYKIIYWVENNYAKIAAVFDCRQDSSKLKKIIPEVLSLPFPASFPKPFRI